MRRHAVAASATDTPDRDREPRPINSSERVAGASWYAEATESDSASTGGIYYQQNAVSIIRRSGDGEGPIVGDVLQWALPTVDGDIAERQRGRGYICPTTNGLVG